MKENKVEISVEGEVTEINRFAITKIVLVGDPHLCVEVMIATCKKP